MRESDYEEAVNMVNPDPDGHWTIVSHAPKIHRLMMYNICWNKERALARIL